MANEVLPATISDEVLRDRHMHSSADIARTKIAQRVNAIDGIALTALRVWDALHTLLPSAGAADDLALITGTLGTNSPMVQTGDLKAAGATTRYARFQFALPNDYEDGETITLRVYAGMITTVADTTATIDAQVYLVSKSAGTVGSDICATAAQSINSLSGAGKSFTITPTGLVAGDVLDIRLAVAVNDAATGTAVIGAIYAVEILSDRR